MAEVARQRDWSDDSIVVNLQGDEPLMPVVNIQQVAMELAQHEDASVATLCEPVDSIEQLHDPGVVKVVFDANGRAAYFSRAPIPYCRGRFEPCAGTSRASAADGLHYRHIGLYAYRAGFLERFASLAPAPSELAESLEQLRAIHHGFPIHVEVARERPGPGVDTPADLERVRAIFEETALAG